MIKEIIEINIKNAQGLNGMMLRDNENQEEIFVPFLDRTTPMEYLHNFGELSACAAREYPNDFYVYLVHTDDNRYGFAGYDHLLEPIFNIKDFGAKDDGSDCTEAIQRTIDTANSCKQKSTVKFPAGQWMLGKTLHTEGPAKLEGENNG